MARGIYGGVRPTVRGKFIWVGNEKLYVRGVTYGTFRPDEDGNQYHDLELIERDFAAMAVNGINAVRVYNSPPHALLDLAAQNGLRVVVDLAGDQYVGFLTDKDGAPDIGALVRAKVRAVSGHPAILAYSLGNEIPAALVRWHGRRRIERYLRRLHRVVGDEDPGAMITYVNYPSTEYLQLPFLDFYCFNVYLESRDRFAAYLARLQNLVGDFPLVMGEIGLDSFRNGEQMQAQVLGSQIRTAFEHGCAGVFAYAWTDEWYRGGAEAEDWAFGLTDRDRRPKPGLAAVREAYSEVPLSNYIFWPSVSVVVCSYNGARTIRQTCEELRKLQYDNFDVIVVDDGSTDGTAEIARAYGFHVIVTRNRGLSHARNTGLRAATGEIVAYLDDDAYPDPQWLSNLAHAFRTSHHAAIGGPNIPPPGNGIVADCIATAPGGPVHVLVSDCEAEHIPGCNMAFRKADLEAIGGFDPQFRVAGDDVDVCWRLRDSGRTIGFCPAAMVWHHRRGSVRTYWKQQRGYGKAEALLESKWPEKYNAAGHVSWAGRVYGNGHTRRIWSRGRIYQGTWGCAPFQSIYEPAAGLVSSLPLMPEWYLLIPALGAASMLAPLWRALAVAAPLLVIAVAISVIQAGVNAARTRFVSADRSAPVVAAMRVLTACLHLLQPAARLCGRLSHGLTPWRRRVAADVVVPRPRHFAIWSERWRAAHERLQSLESTLRSDGACVLRGGDFDRWDLEVRGSIFGAARLRMAVEEHGLGRQLARFRVWPQPSVPMVMFSALMAALSIGALRDGAWAAAAIIGVLAVTLAARIGNECALATSALLAPIEAQQQRASPHASPSAEEAPPIATTEQALKPIGVAAR
jgi:GT2 family glycosyltransferase